MCALCMRQSRETLHELLTRRLGEMPESLVSSVKSFPSGSAPGPSGLRPTHVRKAVLYPSADRSRESLLALTKFINLLASGRTPQSVLEVLRRLVSKCLAQAVRSSALSVLAPLQLGVNVKGGCEAIIHAVSHLMNSPSNQRWILLLDFTNAFNSVDRQAMFADIRHRIPSLSAWIEGCYSCQPILRLGQDTHS